MIRPATAADYPAFAALFRELGVDDPPPSRERFATDLARDTLVGEHEGEVIGYVTCVALGETGHVRNLAVAAHARRSGVGRRLMAAAARALRARGVTEWHLNVHAGNAAAVSLYEALGLELEHRSTVLRLPWSELDGVPREPATVLPVDAEQDAEIERALDLLAGRIAMGRARPGRLQLQLRDERCAPVGFATFAPELGAMPFRVARPTLAATLLEALRPHARAEHVQLVVEDQAAVVELLAAHGAVRHRELLHYRGAVPA